ncbi:MAG: LD-carboxypeptidase [Desulfobacterales bacterium]|nr:LD-carboxypeptidase [Desulfobacterales bacterium]
MRAEPNWSDLLLKAGDTLGVVAPSGAFDSDLLAKGIRTLETMGFKVKIHPGVHGRKRYLAGSDAQRAQGINAMFADPEVNAVIAARGGSGGLRILELIDWDLMAGSPKLMIGFSDVSALLAPMVDRGMVGLHGPNLVSMASPHPRTREWFFNALTQPPSELILHNAQAIQPGRAQGKLVGGNLATLNHLTGTRFQPDFSQGILLLEDVGEPAYKIDRMLSQMKLARMFDRIQGVLVGEFVDCGNGEYLPEILGEIFPDLPILAGLPVGHGDLNAALHLGTRVTMDADRGRLDWNIDLGKETEGAR